ERMFLVAVFPNRSHLLQVWQNVFYHPRPDVISHSAGGDIHHPDRCTYPPRLQPTPSPCCSAGPKDRSEVSERSDRICKEHDAELRNHEIEARLPDPMSLSVDVFEADVR